MAGCVDTARERVAGSPCGLGRVCTGAGNCITCAEGTSCSGNPSAPCKRGLTTCGATPGCVDGMNAAAGASCGTNQVCTATGTCVACTAGAMCTTNAGSTCRRGVVECSTGAPVCVDDALKAPGTACGMDQVCNVAGTCVACASSGSCTTNPSPACRNGATSCATGTQTCTDGTPKAAGTMCGAGQVCDASGFCGMCTASTACSSNPGAPCKSGIIDCGPDRVCNSSGSCVACVASQACATNPNPGCKTGVTSCTSGAQTCVDSGNRAPGTVCGTNQVCSPGGNCVTCSANVVCVGNSSPGCRNGITSCATGSTVCLDNANTAAGTNCGAGQVCNGTGACLACAAGSGTNQVCDSAGACTACSAGAGCTTNPGSACKNGTITCGTGSPVCSDGSEKTNGTACPGGVCSGGFCSVRNAGDGCTTNPSSTCRNGVIDCATGSAVCPGGVCNGGSCNPCSGGAGCSPANPCKTGSINCSSGSGVCVESGNVGIGTACPGGVCNTGSCVACSPGAACMGNPSACKTGVVSCTTGAPVCADGTNVANLTACTGGRCVSGGCCAGCVQNPTTTPACAGGFLTSAYGMNGLNCRVCPNCAQGRIRTCDTGECFCEI